MDIDDEIIVQALINVNFGSILGEDKKGLNKNVGIRGSHLSGGQKQKIGVVRGMLRKAQIYLLDEVNSGLDRES